MTKTVSSRRISSAMASRSASRTVMVTISVPLGRSGSGGACNWRGALTFAGVGAGSTCISGCLALAGGAVVGDFCGRAAPPSVNAEASSPSPRIMAIGVLTATSLVPSGTKILPRVPSSTSMVALSVSISAITSPDLTESPSFLCHLARLPFSMVGESAGIRTGVGIDASPVAGGAEARREIRRHRIGEKGDVRFVDSGRHVLPGVYVGPELGRIGLRVVSGEFGGFVDGGANFSVDLLQRVLTRKALLQ